VVFFSTAEKQLLAPSGRLFVSCCNAIRSACGPLKKAGCKNLWTAARGFISLCRAAASKCIDALSTTVQKSASSF
jgi:hypothetical protein